MKKHELLKHAYDNYPKGTKFKNLATGHEVTSSGNFELNETGIFNSGKGLDNAFLYGIDKYMPWHGKWAEIVKPKIAVKVENEKECIALEKHFKSLGWRFGSRQWPLVKFYDNTANGYSGIPINKAIRNAEELGYQIIPFSEFAAENGIKLPLFISDENIEMYEGMVVYTVNKETLKINSDHVKLHNDYTKCGFKRFNFHQNALSWIEAQKPKEINLDCGIVNSKGFIINPKYNFMEKWEVMSVLKAFEELS